MISSNLATPAILFHGISGSKLIMYIRNKTHSFKNIFVSDNGFALKILLH